MVRDISAILVTSKHPHFRGKKILGHTSACASTLDIHSVHTLFGYIMPTELEEVRLTKARCDIQRLTNSIAGGIPPPRKHPDQTDRYEMPLAFTSA